MEHFHLNINLFKFHLFLSLFFTKYPILQDNLFHLAYRRISNILDMYYVFFFLLLFPDFQCTIYVYHTFIQINILYVRLPKFSNHRMKIKLKHEKDNCHVSLCIVVMNEVVCCASMWQAITIEMFCGRRKLY